MSKSLPLIAMAGALALLATAPVAAQELPQSVEMGKLTPKQVGDLVGAVAGSVGRDTLKLQPAAKARDCTELVRAANSFALGYSLLDQAGQALADDPPKEAAPVLANVVQARLITFAARVKAEEWLSRLCASYTPPEEHAGEARYAIPAKLQTREYTQALIEARQVADTNLAIAVSAGMTKNCAATFSSLGAIQLLIPYLEKLSKDVAKRPLALGPRASRRGLEVAKTQLVNAGNKLYREVGLGCAGPRTAGQAAGAAPDPAAGGAAEPATPGPQ